MTPAYSLGASGTDVPLVCKHVSYIKSVGRYYLHTNKRSKIKYGHMVYIKIALHQEDEEVFFQNEIW